MSTDEKNSIGVWTEIIRIWWWVLPSVTVIASVVGVYCFWKSLPCLKDGKMSSIIYGTLSLIVLAGMLGIGYLGLWTGYKLTLKKADLARQHDHEKHEEEMLQKQIDKAGEPVDNSRKWQMENLLKLAGLLKDKMVAETDKDGNKKTVTDNLNKDTKTKLNTLFDSITKPNQPPS